MEGRERLFSEARWEGARTLFGMGIGALVTGALSYAASFFNAIAVQGIGAIIFAGVGAVCAILLAVSAVLAAWRYFHPIVLDTKSPATHESPGQVDTDPMYSADPESEALDRDAYNEIVAFSLDYVLPACVAQIDLQSCIIGELCNSSEVARLAHHGMQTHEGLKVFWDNYSAIDEGLNQSPGPIIKFDALLNCIFEIERSSYSSYCGQPDLLVAATRLDYKRQDNLRPLWETWRIRHNALVEAYEGIKRDSRFGKLFRPARDSRWGGIVPSLQS